MIPVVVRSLVPSPFWRELRLEHEVRVGRLAVFLIGGLLLLYLGFAIGTTYASAAGELWYWRNIAVAIPGQVGAPQAPAGLLECAWESHRHYLFMPFVTVWSDPGGSRIYAGPFAGAWFLTLVAGVVAMPLSFLLLPQTFRAVRIRRVHLLRGVAYTFPAPIVCALLWVAILSASATSLRSPFEYRWMVTVIALCLYFFSWFRFTTSYLRLRQAGFVWCAMTTISLLCAGIVAEYRMEYEI